MDPICHTLVGAALGCTGLEKKTRHGRATLIIAANLPDIDVVAHFMGGTASYAFRRGVTHGVPALIVLPVLLALTISAWQRARPARSTDPPASFLWLYILAAIGVVTHPTLDWLNTYGMRWLMPMVNEWFYGDTLFIIEWFAWLALLIGVVATRFVRVDDLRWFARPASVALAVFCGFIVMNAVITRTAEDAALEALSHDPPARLLASPVPLNPFRRVLVLEYEDHYQFADFRIAGEPGFQLRDRRVEKGDPRNLEHALATRDGRWFLHWARFPYSIATSEGRARKITIADARYVPDIDDPRIDGFAVYSFVVPEPAAGDADSR